MVGAVCVLRVCYLCAVCCVLCPGDAWYVAAVCCVACAGVCLGTALCSLGHSVALEVGVSISRGLRGED